MVDPGPPPVTPGQKWYASSAFWTWLLQTLVSLGTGIGVIIGHPFDSAEITAIVPSAAFVIAGLTTAVFVHGQQQLQQQKAQHAHELRMLQLR